MKAVRWLVVVVFGLAVTGWAADAEKVREGLARNTAVDLGLLVESEVGEDWGVVDDVSGFHYDPVGRQMLMFGGGHATTDTDVVYALGLKELKWRALYSRTPQNEMRDEANYLDQGLWAWMRGEDPVKRPLARHTYDLMAIDPKQGVMVMFERVGYSEALAKLTLGRSEQERIAYFTSPKIAEFEIKKRQWAWYQEAEGSDRPPFEYGDGAAEYDPESGQVVIVGYHTTGEKGAGIWLYDSGKKKARRIVHTDLDIGYVGTLVYFPPNKKMYFFSWPMDVGDLDKDGETWDTAPGKAGSVWEIALNREHWEKSTIKKVTGMTGTPHWTYLTPGFAYDSVNHLIGGAIQDGVFHAYDPEKKKWSSQQIKVESKSGGQVGDLSHFSIDFDSQRGAYIFIADGKKQVYDSRRTWVYRW